MEIKRDAYLQQLIERKDNGMIKVITGIRRCGKSFLLFTIFKRYLLENGIDAEQGQELIDSYVEMFKKELDIDEGDFRKFGAADNSTAKEYYQMLIDGELTGSDIWTVDTPIDGEEENEEG